MAIAAAVVAACHRSLPLVLDGYVVTASVLPLVLPAPTVLEHCTVGLLRRAGTPAACSTVWCRLASTSTCVSAAAGRWPPCSSSPACAGITEVPTVTEWFSVDNQALSTESIRILIRRDVDQLETARRCVSDLR